MSYNDLPPPHSATPKKHDRTPTLRALRRAVYVHKTLPVEVAWKILELHGLPRSALDEPEDAATI